MYDEKMFDLLKGSTILDPEVFRKKNEFFYDTSYDILIKGDLGNPSKYLEIFEECEKKARITSNKPALPHPTPKMYIYEWNKRNNLYYNGSIKGNSSMREAKSLKGSKSESFFHKSKELNSSSSQPLEGSFRNTRASSFMGQSMDKFKRNSSMRKTHGERAEDSLNPSKMEHTLKLVRATTTKIPSIKCNLLEKNSKIIKLFSHLQRTKDCSTRNSNLDSDRSRTLVILRDYFKSKQYNQIKSRYIQLFGNETFSQRIKQANSRLMNTSSPPLKAEKDKYIRVLNDNSYHANQKTSKNKYDSIGSVKVLNVPVDFYNSHDLYYSEDKSLFAQNARKLYAVDNKAERRMKKHSAYLSGTKEVKAKDKGVLSSLLKRFGQFELKGIKIKNNILGLRQYLNKKSPIIDSKIFAFIDENSKQKSQSISLQHLSKRLDLSKKAEGNSR